MADSTIRAHHKIETKITTVVPILFFSLNASFNDGIIPKTDKASKM